MANRWILSGVVALAVATASFGLVVADARAERVTATVVLKSGERLVGHNLMYRFDKGELILRTSPSEEPRVAVDRIAYIEFTGASDVSKIDLSGTGSPHHAVVLRDGTVLKGKLEELGHGQPGHEDSQYLVIFRTQDGQEHRLEGERVQAVYLTEPQKAVSTTGVTAGPGEIAVSSQQQWTPTGIFVRKGEVLTFTSRGEITLSAADGDMAGPAGSVTRRFAPASPIPSAYAGALIGRIGTGEAFGIGNQTAVPMPAAGQLFLGINDDSLADNTGQFVVQVERRRR